LPTDLEGASREAVATIMDPLPEVVLMPPGPRPRKIFTRAFRWSGGCDGVLRLIDIPTTMSAIKEGVEFRFGPGVRNADVTAYPWTWLEAQEFEKFRAVLRRASQADTELRGPIRRHIVIEEDFDLQALVDARRWRPDPRAPARPTRGT
jgi:hypothetical protein